MRLGDDARRSVVFFGTRNPGHDGAPVLFRGTGFIIGHKEENITFIYLVTAAHVAKALSVSGEFVTRVNMKEGSAYEELCRDVRWYFHEDSSVDVAIAEYMPPEGHDCVYFSSANFLTKERRESKKIGAGDLIQIVGLFRLLAGTKRNLPIVHTGHLALVPEEGERIPQKNQDGDVLEVEGYLVEAQTLQGLSGSPVFVRRTLAVLPAPGTDTGLQPKGYGAVFLLGLYSGAWDGEPGEILSADRTSRGTLRVPVGMGIAVPAPKITEVINCAALREARRLGIEVDRQEAAIKDAPAAVTRAPQPAAEAGTLPD